MPKVISIHSYRGGTGKSNFTANLAATLAIQGHRVGVVDTDIPSPGIHNIFCLDAKEMEATLNNYLWKECAIQEAVYDVSKNIGLDDGGRLFLVPSSSKPDDIARILKNGYDVSFLNDGLREVVKDFQLDYLFIDTHPGLSKETFLSMAISHLTILILRPDKQDYQGLAVTIDVARQLGVKKMLIAVNKALSSSNFAALQQKVEEAYHLSVAGVFPLSEDIVKLASEGVFCLRYPSHPISKEFAKVARQVEA